MSDGPVRVYFHHRVQPMPPERLAEEMRLTEAAIAYALWETDIPPSMSRTSETGEEVQDKPE